MASPADAFDRRNLLTYLSLLCGVAAMAAASTHHAHVTGLAVALGVIADTFDGRFARRFGSDPRRRALGVQLDSLTDAIAFGIAPPLCSALLLDEGSRVVGAWLWAAAFVYAACAVTRLASFNVDAADENPGGFIGIPVPLAALIWTTVLLVQPAATVSTCVLLVTAVAMVSPLPIPRPTGAGLVLFTCWPLGVALCHVAFGIRH
jgi:CDP-diacylglycerol--serine O-phosphatidyltransferase